MVYGPVPSPSLFVSAQALPQSPLSSCAFAAFALTIKGPYCEDIASSKLGCGLPRAKTSVVASGAVICPGSATKRPMTLTGPNPRVRKRSKERRHASASQAEPSLNVISGRILKVQTLLSSLADHD